jgi:hypothetical protein
MARRQTEDTLNPWEETHVESTRNSSDHPAALAGASAPAPAGLKSYISAQVNTWGNTISISGALGDARNIALRGPPL